MWDKFGSMCFLWFIFRILVGNPKKELLRGLWVSCRYQVEGFRDEALLDASSECAGHAESSELL